MLNPTSTIVGSAQTGFTSPTYGLEEDIAPSLYGKQWAVTAVGGTQPNVDPHSADKPFTVSFFRPATIKPLPAANPVTGIVGAVPVNTYKLVVRKGTEPLAGQATKTASINVSFNIPAGVTAHKPEEVRAMTSALIGFLTDLSAEIGDSQVSGLI